MHEKHGKQLLIEQMESYVPFNDLEAKHKNNILKFLHEDDNNFERSNVKGHITGSAWLLNEDKTKVLLNHHRKLDKWMNFGGHADGDADILSVAIREAQEESGIENILSIADCIFDIDVHVIPANATKGEPEHLHYDIRYLLWTPDQDYVLSHESINLKWVDMKEALQMLKSDSLVRMIEKWKQVIAV